jgi:hypothetical protein
LFLDGLLLWHGPLYKHKVMTYGRARLCSVAILLAACAAPKPPVESLSGEDLSAYTLAQVRGTRDGDRLDAEAKFVSGASALTVEMRFAVGTPTRLSSGRWRWSGDGHQGSGSVAERSVTFLGGQMGPPSMGGRFDLLDPSGTPKYRITIPTTELKIKFQ